MKVLITAGGTGGHLFPAEQLAKKALASADQVLFAGHGLTKSSLFKKGFDFKDIKAASPSNPLRFVFSTCIGLFQAIVLICKFSPDVVVGFGSYHTFPTLLASVIIRKKVILFEANTSLGKVNRFFAPFAKKITSQFSSVKSAVLVPLLPWWQKKQRVTREEGLNYFGLQSSKFTILVFGGSQGSQFLNDVMPEVAKGFLDVQWIHITGKEKTCVAYTPYMVPFETKMDLAYAASDMVISRSGASTLAEIIYHNKPSLLIPFPFASENHQMKNALFLVEKLQGARLLDQSNATCEKIRQEIQYIRQNGKKLQNGLNTWKVDGRSSLYEELLK